MVMGGRDKGRAFAREEVYVEEEGLGGDYVWLGKKKCCILAIFYMWKTSVMGIVFSWSGANILERISFESLESARAGFNLWPGQE